MVGVVLLVRDAVDSGSRIRSPPCQQDRARLLLHLRRGPCRGAHGQFKSRPAVFQRDWPTARKRSYRARPRPFIGSGHSRSSCHLGIPTYELNIRSSRRNPYFLPGDIMTTSYQRRFVAIAVVSLFLITTSSFAQSAGNSGSINGTVEDPTGAVVPNATVEIRNPVSGYERSTTSDASGKFSFPNIPYNPYHLTPTAAGFV